MLLISAHSQRDPLAHSSKDGEKADKEKMMKEALQSAKLWEARHAAVEKSRLEYRENARRLVTENESLQGAVNQVRGEGLVAIGFRVGGATSMRVDCLNLSVRWTYWMVELRCMHTVGVEETA